MAARRRSPDDIAALKAILAVCEKNDGLCCDSAKERRKLAEAVLAELNTKFMLLDKPRMRMPEEVAKRFLDYSFEDIDYKYEELTKMEKEICTPEEFKLLKQWMSK